MFQPDQELLQDKTSGRIYYHVQFFCGEESKDGIWLYASGLDRTRDLTMGEMERWIALLDKQGRPYRLYQFQEITTRRFVGGSEAEGAARDN